MIDIEKFTYSSIHIGDAKVEKNEIFIVNVLKKNAFR